jgi:hypothetical protein
MDIVERLTSYLSGGGLFNPELADHDKVKDLVIDCWDEIERLRIERDGWKQIAGIEADERRRSHEEIERLREDIKEANARAYVMAKEVTIWQDRVTVKALGEKE